MDGGAFPDYSGDLDMPGHDSVPGHDSAHTRRETTPMPLTTSTSNGRADQARSTRPTAAPVSTRPPKGDSEANRRQARSVAKQQQAAERIASATGEISAQNAEAARSEERRVGKE